MSVNNNENINRMVTLVFIDRFNSAINLLKSCSFTEEQKKSIESILEKTSRYSPEELKDLKPQEVKDRIAACLSGRVENRTQMIVPEAPQPIATHHFLNFATDISSHIFAFCNAIGLDALAICCKTLYHQKPAQVLLKSLTPPEIQIVKELRTKKSLNREEMNHYLKALGGKPQDWNCVLQYCPQLERLDLKLFFIYNNYAGRETEENEIISILQSTIIHCHRITNLNLRGSPIGDKTLAVLSKHFPNLTHLSLADCNYSLKSMMNLLECSKNLTSLNLSYRRNNEKEESKIINWIADNCPLLTELNLRCDHCIDHFLPKDPIDADNAIILLTMKCRNLMKLSIPGTQITDESLVYLGKNCTKLTFLLVVDCRNITKNGKDALKLQLPALQMPTQYPFGFED